jgi:hypothetical protein
VHRVVGEDEERRTSFSESLEEADHMRARRSYDPLLLALLWRSATTAADRARVRFGASRVRLQRYEELVRRPEDEVRALCQWLSVEYSSDMLKVPLIQSSSGTADRDIAQFPRHEPVERWKRHMTDREVASIESGCRRQMRKLGYPSHPPSPRSAVVIAWALLPLAGMRAYLRNRHRFGGGTRSVFSRIAGTH